jgi:succinylglutamate desuccinylase
MKVIIFGGTHGNEWTGVMIVKKYQDYFTKNFPDLKLNFIHANPKAYEINKRFKDEDLNRAFSFLKEKREHSYEHLRAKEIKTLIEDEPCFVIDLHTTTANMGETIIVSHHSPLNLHVASVLLKQRPECKIISSPDPQRKYLASQSEHGLMIEVGPVANGTINAQALESTFHLLKIIFEILQSKTLSSGEIEVYEEVEDIFYPTDSAGEIAAYIHRDLQNKDFSFIKGDYKAFTHFDGHDLTLTAKDEVYPIFINEAAYYPSQLAFSLCRKAKLHF